jgi:hypothetical protein
MRNCLLCLPGEFFVNKPLNVKEIDEHVLDLVLHLSRLFRFQWIWTFRVRLMVSSPNTCLIIAGVSVALFLIILQNLTLFLSGIHRKTVSGQIHDST